LMRVEKGGFLSPAERTGAVVKAIQRGWSIERRRRQ
jgi:hypothetical protein